MELSTYAGDFRAFKALITAQVAGVSVAVKEVDAKGSSPNSVPVLSTPNGAITQSNAIARYIARSRPEAGLYGQTFFQSGQVDSWIDWGTNNVELPAILTTYWQFGWQPFNFQANKKALEDLAAAFAELEAHLLSRTFLVGQRLSLADIIVASQLFYPLKLSLDGAFRAQFPATLRWFSHVTAIPASAAVLGAVVYCAKTPAAPKNANKKDKKKQGGGKKDKKKEAAPAAAPAPAPKKKEKNPLDLLPKSSFVLDDWKRTYSNSTTDYFKSMDWFWPNFDKEGWSIWFQEFNHNDENTKDFIVCNKIEGYVQRTIGIQKYAFGVMQMLDTFERLGYYTVAGVWLIRGQDIKPMLDVNPESSIYTWTRLDDQDEATRKRIAAYWCGETDIDGENCYDAKVFK
eukprot:INCI1141.1.p2 GENE.INCI1141.1~~INCI1141.1.p2  ORF type:complete len:430 (+),score=77.98 INCI1141.1:88-1290(+)